MKVWADLQNGKAAINEKNESLFLLALLADEDLRKSLSEEDIRKCFDYNYYTKMLMQSLARTFK